MTPQLPPQQGYCVRKRRLRLSVPSSRTNDSSFGLHQCSACQSDFRVERHQVRRSSRYSKVIPLPLRLNPEMSAGFLKGHFHRPSSHKPRQYLLRRVIAVGRKQCLRLELALRIANQHPANRDRRQPLVAFSHHAQGSRDGAFTGCEDGAGQKEFGVLENRVGKQRGETY